MCYLQISMEISSDFERVRPYVTQMYQELREVRNFPNEVLKHDFSLECVAKI